ncbi:hypothetical protein ACH47Z_13880 [Streptomyces sp. NPDC020192]|uniref:SCO2400 family protein n=1 Tax=Streptomyces sp. NPDC020192 TaxID=3365066 RepID=UPI0037B96E71
MDYCSSCRRHLNGALVCPGCGAYAPDIAPPGTAGTAASVPAARTPAAAEPPYTWYDDEPGTDAEAEPAAADVTDAPPAPQGRAARRRQLARWKKSQRRAVVATAVALVGGGLTLASMDRGSGDRAQAASAPDHRSMGIGEQPASPSLPSAGTPTPAGSHRQATGTPHTSTPRTAPVGYVDSGATVPQQRTQSSAPRHAAPASRTDTAPTTPRSTGSTDPTSTPVPQSGGTSSASSGTGTTAAPTPGTGSGSGTSTGTSTGGSSDSGQAPTSSSSDKLCLVLVCLG